jgi:thiamine pyrophosphokinase
VIAGDFDSIEDDVASFYKQSFDGFKVDFRQDGDQYSTDFDKAMDVVKLYETTNKVAPSPRHQTHRKIKESLSVVALGGFAGRVDQSFSLLHQLFKCVPRHLYLISPQNISFLLPPGRNSIVASADIFGPCCGIIPVSGPATITLEGFRWNLGTVRV